MGSSVLLFSSAAFFCFEEFNGAVQTNGVLLFSSAAFIWLDPEKNRFFFFAALVAPIKESKNSTVLFKEREAFSKPEQKLFEQNKKKGAAILL